MAVLRHPAVRLRKVIVDFSAEGFERARSIKQQTNRRAAIDFVYLVNKYVEHYNIVYSKVHIKADKYPGT